MLFLILFVNIWINMASCTLMITPWILVSGDLVRNFYSSTEKCKDLFYKPKCSLPTTETLEEKTCERYHF